MCVTKEEIERIVEKQMLELLPVCIARGINEASSHLRMSQETKLNLENHEQRIVAMEGMLGENTKFHEKMAPILTAIQEDLDARKYIKNRIFSTSKVVGALAVIFASTMAFVDYIFSHYRY